MSSFKEASKRSADRAEAILRGIADPPWNYEMVDSVVHDYVLTRFLLDGQGVGTENISELSKLSLESALARFDAGDLTDLSLTCTGASSASTKKILLLLSLNRGLEITISPAEAVEIETISQLSRAVLRKLAEKQIPA